MRSDGSSPAREACLNQYFDGLVFRYTPESLSIIIIEDGEFGVTEKFISEVPSGDRGASPRGE